MIRPYNFEGDPLYFMPSSLARVMTSSGEMDMGDGEVELAGWDVVGLEGWEGGIGLGIFFFELTSSDFFLFLGFPFFLGFPNFNGDIFLKARRKERARGGG